MSPRQMLPDGDPTECGCCSCQGLFWLIVVAALLLWLL